MEEILFIIFIVASLAGMFFILFSRKILEKHKEKGGSFVGILLETRKSNPIVGWSMIAIFLLLLCFSVALYFLNLFK